MFDDLDKQNITPPASPIPQPAGSPSKGEGVALPGGAKTTEDIFAEVDKPVKPEVFQLRPAGAPRYSTVIPADDSWLKNRKLIFGSLAGIFVLLAGGYLVLSLLAKSKAPPEQAGGEEQSVSNQAESPAAPAGQPASQSTVSRPLDSDQDGLTDEEETALGTDTNNPDSDNDGLTDREEAKVYSTNPLNPDTDSDSYKDGEEVSHGYNPKGPGKLLNVDQ